MGDKLPQPTGVLVDRLRRVAKACDRESARIRESCSESADEDDIAQRVMAWKARANTCWQVAGVLFERDTLKAAIEQLTAGMDRAGGDACAMPECPWCQAQGTMEGDDNWHRSDCELELARAALAACVPPQETEK